MSLVTDSTEIIAENHSFLRRYLSSFSLALTCVLPIPLALLLLAFLLCLVFPLAILPLTMMFAYGSAGIEQVLVSLLFSIPLASLAASILRRDSATRRTRSITAYIIVGVVVTAVQFSFDYADSFYLAVIMVLLSTLGPSLYINSSPEAKLKIAAVQGEAIEQQVEFVAENFDLFEKWLDAQKCSKDDPRSSSEAWSMFSYRDATVFISPGKAPRTALMVRAGRSVSFQDEGNRKNEYVSSYEALLMN